MRFQFDSVEQSIVVDAWIASFSLACNQLTLNSGTVLNSLKSCRLWSQVYSRYDGRQKRSAVTTLVKLYWILWSLFRLVNVIPAKKLLPSHVCLMIDGNPVWHQDFFVFFNTIFVSSHMYPENPEGTQVIVGSMKHGIYIRHCQESNSQPVPSQAGVDTTRPQWRISSAGLIRQLSYWTNETSFMISISFSAADIKNFLHLGAIHILRTQKTADFDPPLPVCTPYIFIPPSNAYVRMSLSPPPPDIKPLVYTM